MMKRFVTRFANAMPHDAALRCKMVEAIKKGTVNGIHFRPADGTAIADNGDEAIWKRTQIQLLLGACKQYGVKTISYHTETSWNRECLANRGWWYCFLIDWGDGRTERD